MFLTLASLNAIKAQFKYEKESVVPESEVPESAREMISGINSYERLVWYKEQSIDKYSFEAKLKLDGSKYSIEFDSTGILEDIELLLKWKELPAKTKSGISEYLNSTFNSWRVKRLQLQISGALGDCMKYLNGDDIGDGQLSYRYEIIARIKSNRNHMVKEFLFDESGEFIESRTLILDAIDNLEF